MLIHWRGPQSHFDPVGDVAHLRIAHVCSSAHFWGTTEPVPPLCGREFRGRYEPARSSNSLRLSVLLPLFQSFATGNAACPFSIVLVELSIFIFICFLLISSVHCSLSSDQGLIRSNALLSLPRRFLLILLSFPFYDRPDVQHFCHGWHSASAHRSGSRDEPWSHRRDPFGQYVGHCLRRHHSTLPVEKDL